MEKRPSLFSSYTEGFILFFAFLTAYFLAVGALIFIFWPFNENYWTIVDVLVIISFIIFVIVFIFLALIRKLIKKRRSGSARFKCFSLIGYGGIALCSFVPRICVFFFVGNDFYIRWYIAFISFAISFQIYYIILRPNSKHFKIDYSLNGTLSWFWKLVVFHIIVFIVAMRIALALFEDKNEIGKIAACQFVFLLISVPSVFEFCQIWRGGVKLRKNNDDNNGDNQKQGELVTVKVRIPKETRDSGPENKLTVECKICMLEYSETRIPRMLKECGHTICEECANELLEKNNQRHLCCPFCQETTLVKGPANLLPKNYVALEVVEKMKCESKL